MMNKPAPAPRKIDPEKKAHLMENGKKIWRSLTHQWGWKLTSLILAICLWGGLISQDTTLPREKTFENIRVNITNEETLRQNGLIVVSGLEKVNTVRIKAQVPQRNYSAATAANYNVRLDLSQIKSPGVQKARIVATPVSASLYGAVTDLSMEEVTLVVEEYATRARIPVQVEVIGQGPEGFYLPAPTPNPAAVEIGGPKSLIEQVARCIVIFDQGTLPAKAGSVLTSVSYILQDYQGREVDASHITVSSQSINLRDIIVDQDLYPLTDVRISTQGLVSGQPAEGYQITNISVSPQSVQIAAMDLDPFLGEDAAIQPYNRINIEGASQTMASTLSLRRPTGADYISNYDVRVTVTIEKIDGETEGNQSP